MSSSTKKEATPFPADLRITIGEGGGFSGLWSGYSIHAGDTVYEWKGRSFGDNPVHAGTLPHDSLVALWQGIGTSGLLEHQSNLTRANYVQALSVRANGTEHTFMWEPSASTDSTIAAAAAIRARCLSSIHTSLRP